MSFARLASLAQIGELARRLHDYMYTSLEMHREREFLGKTIQTGSSRSVKEFMRSQKHVKHHSYLVCNEANFLLGEHKIAI